MNKLSVKFENCYGIGKFVFDFDFLKANTHLIYAPNGTMKSSFAKTLECIAKNDKEAIGDKVYTDRKPICEVLSDGNPVEADSIFVANAENDNFDATDKISNFIARRELRKQYDAIYTELDNAKNELIKKLKGISQSTDCDGELTATFSEKKDDFFTILLSLEDKIVAKHDRYDFRYNDIFDKGGKVKKFLEKNQPLLDQYFSSYQDLISKSIFFKKSANSFGTTQANGIISSIEDNAFFDAGHKFVLADDTNITSADSLKELVKREISKIINDAALKAAFDKVDKAIGGNAELRAFKNTIEKENTLLLQLKNYDEFRKKVWLGYLYELKDDATQLIALYKAKKAELEKLLAEAKKEVDTWKDIITIFNARFYVPFTVKLANQEDIILKQETAKLVFEYKDKDGEPPMLQPKDSLLKILSKGEKRAYYILQLLFDVEARKSNEKPSLLIFDDIADSFDYKNKYAIIEYLKDLHESEKFKSIVLTHNFDFYRTVSSRLGLDSSVYMSVKNHDRAITLLNGEYRKDVLTYFKSRHKEPKIFISLIPFVRNIVEYSEGNGSDDYITLTNCLHQKGDSHTLTSNDIMSILSSKLNGCDYSTVDYKDKKIIVLILEVAQSIIEDKSLKEIPLENKIVLSIAIRLKAEKFMLKSLPKVDLATITSNQTRELFKEYKKIEKDTTKLQILDKVNLMTPENIHMNAFMYEPLIDMSLHHLISLYKEVSDLT